MLSAMPDKVNRFPKSNPILVPCLICLALAGFLLSFNACAPRPGRGLKDCRFRFHSLAFTGVDAGASHWKLTLGVMNPNAKEITLTHMRYALMHEGDTLLAGENPETRVVPAKDSLIGETNIDIPNAIWQRLPSAIWSQTDVAFVISADAYLHTWLGDIRVPGAIRETVHVDMVQQVARMKEMLLRKMFNGWPGKHLEEGGIAGPDTTAPGQRP